MARNLKLVRLMLLVIKEQRSLETKLN